MSKRIQLRRGTTAEHNTFTGAVGEVTVDTDKKTVVVHDGVTVGGHPVATRANADGTISLIKKDGTSAGTINADGLFNNTLTSTNTNQALTAAQGKVLGDRDFGVNQSWQDVTASRAKNVVYTNNTGKPIEVAIKVAYADDDGGLTVTVGGVDIGKVQGNAPSGTGYWQTTLNFTVPNLVVYSVSGGSGVFGWSELR